MLNVRSTEGHRRIRLTAAGAFRWLQLRWLRDNGPQTMREFRERWGRGALSMEASSFCHDAGERRAMYYTDITDEELEVVLGYTGAAQRYVHENPHSTPAQVEDGTGINTWNVRNALQNESYFIIRKKARTPQDQSTFRCIPSRCPFCEWERLSNE